MCHFALKKCKAHCNQCDAVQVQWGWRDLGSSHATLHAAVHQRAHSKTHFLLPIPLHHFVHLSMAYPDVARLCTGRLVAVRLASIIMAQPAAVRLADCVSLGRSAMCTTFQCKILSTDRPHDAIGMSVS